MQFCSPEVGMFPEASAQRNIPTKDEQHACYMAEHLTIDLLYQYHMNNMYTCNITSHVKGDLSRLIVQGFHVHLSWNL